MHCEGIIKGEDIKLLDRSKSSYFVTGEEGYEFKFVEKNDLIPLRRIEKVKFPAAELEFNMKVYEGNKKIGTYTLEQRPNENIFNLCF